MKSGVATCNHSGPSAGKRRTEAFTLAEVMASMVFMAILIPVALEGLSIASRAGEVAVRKSEAGLVAERVLNESVVTTNWLQSAQSGTVRQGTREYRWSLRNEPWNKDPYLSTMRQLSVAVVFSVQGRDYTNRVSTLVDYNMATLNTQNTTSPP